MNAAPGRRSARRAVRRTVRRAAAALVVATLACVGPASAFELQTLDGTRTRIDDHTGDGRWTLVMLWTTDCIPCEAQKPMIEAFHRDHRDVDARVVGVALDGMGMIDEIRAINARHESSYPVLVAFDDVFAEQFEALTGKPFRATPTYLLYDRRGGFAGANVGPVAREALDRAVARD